MASRRDELRAHQFLKQRAVSALVVHQTDPEQPPFRRPTVAAFWGLGLALLGLAVAGILSFFDTGGSSLKLENGKSVIVDTDNGAVSVYLNDQLHPVPNITSALLVLGQSVSTQKVTSDQLVGIPPGPALGIRDAPDNLPSSNHLLTGAWTMCSQPTTTDPGGTVYKSLLMVGRTPARGTAAGESAVLVRANGVGTVYLVWHGYRHRLASLDADLSGLGLSTADVIPVNSVWLETLPSGPDIKPIGVPDVGAPSAALSGEEPNVRSGQIFATKPSGDSDERQFFLVVGDKLWPITAMQADIQTGTSDIRQAYGGHAASHRPLTRDEAAEHASKQSPSTNPAAAPELTPKFITPTPVSVAICAVYEPGRGVPHLIVAPKLPTGGATVGGRNNLTPRVDRVFVPGGQGALVRIVGNQDKSVAGTLALVTDDGRLFALRDATSDTSAGASGTSGGTAGILGYANQKPVSITGALASRLPRGPTLDPDVAKRAR